MKRILLPCILLMLVTAPTYAQTKLGYYREVKAAFVYNNFKSSIEGEPDDKINGLGLDMRLNYSLLGTLIFRDTDKPFMMGDHIGVGLGMGYYKKPDDDFPFMAMFNLEYGLKACYSINDDLEVGLKWIAGSGAYYTDFKNDFAIAQKPAFVPSVRFGNYMVSGGFGKAKVGTGGDGGKGGYVMAEGRVILGEPDDEANPCLFVRFENYSGEYDESTRKDNCAQISFGFVLM
ncbi:MAG TPA: hypothetical protein VEB86_00720 [Chryseosolibacter sp.]|nr:hypothetical protein [Chryseosolibacter sp.]